MDELNNIAPKLSGIKKDPPFRVPENYFEDLPARLQSRIAQLDDTKKEKPNTIVRILKPALGLAASFAIIFMLVYWPLSKFQGKYAGQNQAGTEAVDENYYSLVAGLDENSLYSLLQENETEEQFNDEELASYLSTTFNDYDLFAEIK